MPRGVYIRTQEIRKKTSESMIGKNIGNLPWNTGLTKETDKRLRKKADDISGKNHFNYGKHLSEELREKISESLKGHNVSEETRKKISKFFTGRKLSDEHKRKIGEGGKGRIVSEETRKKMSEARKGYTHSEETRKKLSEAWKGRIVSEETKQKISDAMQKRKERDGYINSQETRKKMSELLKGRKFTEETKKKMSEAKLGEKNYNWNPNRAEVYAPYGENFYNKNIRNRKWNLQNSKDMLTGTILYSNKKPAYHHIDYDKSNDDPDNHCFVSANNHMRITAYQKNPIKSERYKKILQENTLALKNGEIPKNWSPLNKELFRQEKLKQLDLSSYII